MDKVTALTANTDNMGKLFVTVFADTERITNS